MARQQQQPEQQRNSRGQFTNRPRSQPSRSQRRSGGRRGTTTALSLLAGAGLGLTMMYLFDPETGRERRRRLAERSGELLDSSKELAMGAFQDAGETSQSIGSGIATKASNLAHRARQCGSRAVSSFTMSNEEALDRAKQSLADISAAGAGAASASGSRLADLRHYLADRAHAARDYAANTFGTMRHRADLALHGEETHYARNTATAVGSLALGAGLVWAFDPRLGRSRRAWLRDKSMHWMRETGDMFRFLGIHAANHLRGTVAETRGYFHRNEPVDDAKLCARVRSELGRVIDDLHAVEVVAQDGHVTLRGTADGAQVQSIASTILGIRGVRGFDNQLRTQRMPATTSQSPAV